MKKIASILLPLTTLSIGASVVQPVIQAKEQFHSISKIENIEKLKIDDQYSVFIQKMSFKFVQQKIIDEFIKENGLHLVCEDLQMLNIKINGKPINPNDFLKIPVFTNMTFKLAGNSKYASGETDLLSVKLRNKINPILPPIVPDNYGLKTVDFAPVQISAEIFKSDDFSKVIQKKLISEIQNKNNMTFNTLDLFKFEISAKPDMNLGEHVVNAEYENSEIDADYYIPETNLQINYTVKDDKEVNINDVKSWLCFNDFNEGSPSITTLTTSADIGNIINQKLEQYNDTGLDNIEGKYGTLIIGDENSTLADVPQEVDKYFKLTPSLLQKSNKYGLYLNPFQNNPNADNKGYATTKPIDFTWISSDGEKEKFYDSMRLKIDKGNLLMPSQITKALTNLNIEFTLNKQQDLDNLENTIMKTIQNTDTQFYNKLIYSGVKKDNINIISVGNEFTPSIEPEKKEIKFSIINMRDYNNIVVTINPTVQWKQTTISFSTKSQEKIFNWPDEHDPWFNCNSPWIDGWKYNYDKFLSGQISKINKSMIKNVFFYVNMVTFTYQYGTKIVIKNQWTDKIDLTNSFKNTGLSDNIYFSTNDWSKGGRPWADFGILDKKGNKILFAKSGTDIGSSETTAPNGGYFDINYNDFIY